MTSNAVISLKAYLPALDFQVAKQFYVDLGFVLKSSGTSNAEFQVGTFSFVLLNLSSRSTVHGVYMHLEVEDAEAWWLDRKEFEEIKRKYPDAVVSPPLKHGGWQMIYLVDPSGNKWQISSKDRRHA